MVEKHSISKDSSSPECCPICVFHYLNDSVMNFAYQIDAAEFQKILVDVNVDRGGAVAKSWSENTVCQSDGE